MKRTFILFLFTMFILTSNVKAEDFGKYFIDKYADGKVRADFVEFATDEAGNLKRLEIKYAAIKPDTLKIRGRLNEESVGKAFIKIEADVLGIKTFDGVTYVSGQYSKSARGTIGWSRYLYAKVKYGNYPMPEWGIRIEMDDNFVIQDITADLLLLTPELKSAVEKADINKSFDPNDFADKVFDDLKSSKLIDDKATSYDLAFALGDFVVLSTKPYAVRPLYVVDTRKLTDEELQKFSFKNTSHDAVISKPLYYVDVATGGLVIVK